MLNDVHRTFIRDMCSTEYKCVYWIKDRSHMKKGIFYNELSGCFDLFTCFVFEHRVDSKICPLTWTQDVNKQKDVRFPRMASPQSPPHPGTSTFHYQSDCFLSYNTTHTGFFFFFFLLFLCVFFERWNIRYICHVQIFDPINKICIITIPNLPTIKAFVIIVRKSRLLLC